MSISAANISSQTVGFSSTVSGRVWRWGTRMDVSGASPTFQIVDIFTPMGPLRDTIPIPGDIIRAMADSVTSLLANFKPTILVGPPSSLVFSVDEGRGFSISQTVSLTNSGVYGSLLAGVLTPSAPWIKVSPTVVGSLASNQTGSFEVMVDSTDLLASSSPYSATVSIQDATATNNPRTLPITINVRPKAVISASPLTVTFDVARPLSGPFPAVPSEPFVVENTGPANSVLDFQIVRLTGLSQNWLSSFSPVYGTLTSGQQQTINVYLAPAEGLMPSTYTETLRISGYSVNEHIDVLIKMVIT